MYEDALSRRDIRRLVGARVKGLREERVWSRAELGDRSGLSELEIGLVENGSKPVRTEDLLCLAKGLGVSPAAFFEGW
jgi:transcriptional regulator with XRE-family HTH domain